MSLSTMEAEFVAASEVVRELLGIREMLTEFGVSIKLPMPMHVDYRAAIKQVEERHRQKKQNILTCE